MITSNVAPDPAEICDNNESSNLMNAFVYPVPPFVTVIVSTSPPLSVIETNPPEPSPSMGTFVTVPVVEPPVIW